MAFATMMRRADPLAIIRGSLPLAALLALLAALLSDPVHSPLMLALLAWTLVGSVLLWRGQRRDQALARTIANVLAALRAGDHSVRCAEGSPLLKPVAEQFNALAAHLQDEQRTGQEHLHLVAKTLAALDGAVFAFQHDERLHLVNPAGERLLARPAAQLLGLSAGQLGLDGLFAHASGSICMRVFAGQQGRWQVSHAALRSRGLPGQLLVLQPIEQALRAEEAQAFARLLRVLSHEINNSLAPIASMADTLTRLLPAVGEILDEEQAQDLRGGLRLVEQRSAALQRFIAGYAQLARLPPPQPGAWTLAPLCQRVCRLLEGAHVQLEVPASLRVQVDADQFEQVLINLLRNAREADGLGRVVVQAVRVEGQVSISVLDEGIGLPSSDNLFVPFFTTKAGGAGIGLVLSRQILEAQGGSLELRARSDTRGTIARVTLPVAAEDTSAMDCAQQ